MQRNARKHATSGSAKQAVRSEDYWDYKPTQRVMTSDGFPGVVTAVQDGPHAGNESYEVTLDKGMGGGLYSSSQLRALGNEADEETKTAASDYPELGTLLHDRPDPARQTVYASKTAAGDHSDYGKDTVYLRFGAWPKDERSENNITGHREEGVSAYDLDHKGDPVDPDADFGRWHEHDQSCEPDCDLDSWNEDYGNDTKEEMNGRVHRAEKGRYNGRDFKSDVGHLVKGDMVGVGHDGEPLLRKVKRVGDWIDHKHLFFPGAQPHRLARDPEDEDYRPPKGLRPTAARVLVPGSYLDAYRAEPPLSTSPELHQMLTSATVAGSGSNRRAELDVPDHLLPHLADVAYNDFMAWGEDPERRHDARAAYLVHTQAQRHLDKNASLKSTAMPSQNHPEPSGFSYSVEPTEGASTHLLHGHLGPDHVGTISYALSDDGQALKVNGMHTAEGHEGKGVASAMMDALHREHPTAWINHGDRTQQGLNWWSQYDDPAPERNIHLHHPDSGWGEYFHPLKVSMDLSDNYVSSPEHNPLRKMDSETYPAPERSPSGMPLDYRGSQWQGLQDKTARSQNGQYVDGHGTAPDAVRAVSPNSYDDASTEGDPDPHMTEPLPGTDYRGAELMKGKPGVIFPEASIQMLDRTPELTFGGPPDVGAHDEGDGGDNGKNHFTIHDNPVNYGVSNIDGSHISYHDSIPDALHQISHLQNSGRYSPASVRLLHKNGEGESLAAEYYLHHARWFDKSSQSYNPYPEIADSSPGDIEHHMSTEHHLHPAQLGWHSEADHTMAHEMDFRRCDGERFDGRSTGCNWRGAQHHHMPMWHEGSLHTAGYRNPFFQPSQLTEEGKQRLHGITDKEAGELDPASDEHEYIWGYRQPRPEEKHAESVDSATQNKNYLDEDAATRGHEMDWTPVHHEMTPHDAFGDAPAGHYGPRWMGECKNCGHRAIADVSSSTTNAHSSCDARTSTCGGPGTKWKTEMVDDLMNKRMQEAIGNFGQGVKDNHDRQWLKDQGLEASLQPDWALHVTAISNERRTELREQATSPEHYKELLRTEIAHEREQNRRHQEFEEGFGQELTAPKRYAPAWGGYRSHDDPYGAIMGSEEGVSQDVQDTLNDQLPMHRLNRRVAAGPSESERVAEDMEKHGAHGEGYAYQGDGGQYCESCAKKRSYTDHDGDMDPLSWSDLRRHGSPHGEQCDDCQRELTPERPHTLRECSYGEDCPGADEANDENLHRHEQRQFVKEHGDKHYDPKTLKDINEDLDPIHDRPVNSRGPHESPLHMSEAEASHQSLGDESDHAGVLMGHHDWVDHLKRRDDVENQLKDMFSGPGWDDARHHLETNEGRPTHLSSRTSHLLMGPEPKKSSTARDHLVQHHGYTNDQLAALENSGQNDQVVAAHELEHDAYTGDEDRVGGNGFGAGQIEAAMVPHSHGKDEHGHGRWLRDTGIESERPGFMSLNSRTAAGLDDVTRGIDKAREHVENQHADDLTYVPDWDHLHAALPEDEHDGWMFMERTPDAAGTGGYPAGRLHGGNDSVPPLMTYKHGITRKYLHADANGNSYDRVHWGDKAKNLETVWKGPHHATEALADKGHYSTLEQFGETPQSKYNNDYKLQRNKRLTENGFTVFEGAFDPYRLIVQAATDPSLRFHITAHWRDVVAKAKRIRSEGGVRVTMASDGLVYGEVKGDHGVYETGIQRLPGSLQSVATYSCGCKWGAYHWGADDDFSRYAGRMCSHALALQYEAQSRGMFGQQINIDHKKPGWVPDRVVVKYDINDGRNQMGRFSAQELSPVQQFIVTARRDGESAESISTLLLTAGIRVISAANDVFGDNNVMETPPPSPYGATQRPLVNENPASAGFASTPDPDSWSNGGGAMGFSPTMATADETPYRWEHQSQQVGDGAPGNQTDSDEGGAEATLHEDPEGALPEVDGSRATDLAGGLEDDEALTPNDQSIMTMGTQTDGDGMVMDEALSPAHEDEIVQRFQASAAGRSLGSSGPATGEGDFDIAAGARAHLAKLGMAQFSPGEQAALINESPGVKASNLDRLDIAGTHYAEQEDGDDLWMI